jgi:hypothetical protein
MEIGLIYSRLDPKQTEARDFVMRYIQERGITANITEHEQPVTSPTVIINGQTLTEKRTKPRDLNTRMFPDIEDIACALEQHAWTL